MKSQFSLDYPLSYPRLIVLSLLCLVILALAGCFRSTKVYTADKTVVYNGTVYNVSNVKVFTPRTDGVISPTETISLGNMDKKQFNALLKEHNPIMVRQVIALDDQELVYQAGNVDSWSDFDRMRKKFNSANKKLTSFLGDKKATQLKLK